MAHGVSFSSVSKTQCANWFLLLLASLSAVHGKKQEASGHFVRLPKHSFDRTLTYDNGLAEWLTSGATMPLRDRVSMMPGVLDRHGLLWAKQPLQTSDFEVQFSFVAKGEPGSDGVFAAWLSPHNFSATYDEQQLINAAGKEWAIGLEKTGNSFIGNNPSFTGLGVFFIASAVGGSPTQKVHAVWNSGDQKLTMEEVRTKAVTGAQWLGSEMVVKIRLKADGSIAGTISKKSDAAADANEAQLFTMPAKTIAPPMTAAYIGFSSHSGNLKHMMLDLTGLEARNYDMSRSGGEGADITDAAGWAKVLAEEKKYVDQASQMEAVQRLTKLLSDHVKRYNEMGEAIKIDVAKMERRLDNLGGEFGKLIAETEAFDFQKGEFRIDAVRDHIKSVSTILTQGNQAHDTKLEQVHGVARDLKAKGSVMGEAGKQKVQSVADQAKILEEHAAKGSTQTSGLLLVFVLSVAGLGLLFLNRMRYYEKKHYI